MVWEKKKKNTHTLPAVMKEVEISSTFFAARAPVLSLLLSPVMLFKSDCCRTLQHFLSLSECSPTVRLHTSSAHSSSSSCCSSCQAAGSWGRRKAGWTCSLCSQRPACRQIKLDFCCRPRRVSSSASRVSAGSAGVHDLSAALWSTGQQPGASCCRWRRRK